MDSEARARANVPRPNNKQSLTGLDPYHRLLREAYGDGDRQLPVTKGSFSVPRPQPPAALLHQSPDPSSGKSVDLNAFPAPPGTGDISIAAPQETPQVAGPSRGPSRTDGLLSPAPQEGLWFGSSRTNSRLDYTSPLPTSTTPLPRPLPKVPSRSFISKLSSKDSVQEVILPWRPTYLRRQVLLLFILLFTALIVVLEVLLRVSTQNDGLGKPGTTSRYLWQYGFTLAFVVVDGLWARVEYQARVATPWICMARGPVSAEKTLLQDYVSLWQPVMLVKAVRNGDFIVASAGAVGILLKVLILFATTIAMPKPENVLMSSSMSINAANGQLIMRSPPTHLMVAILGVCIVLTFIALIFVPGYGFLPRDPGSILGLATLLAKDTPSTKSLRGLGSASTKQTREELEKASYSTVVEGYNADNPLNLSHFRIYGGDAPTEPKYQRHAETDGWWSPVAFSMIIRLLIVMILALVILGLEISLRISQQNEGLAVIDRSSYIYLVWTLLPALVMLSLATYFDSTDFWTRTLAPFRHLVVQGSFADSVTLNLVDRWRLGALWISYRIRDVAAIMAILGVLFASLSIVASAALFEAILTRDTSDVVFRSEDFFANNLGSTTDDTVCLNCNNDTLAALAILEENMTYPLFTFDELVMPTLELTGKQNFENSTKFKVHMPIVRPKLTCRSYRADEVLTNLTTSYTMDNELINPLRIDVQGEPCRGKTERRASNIVIATSSSGSDDVDSNDESFGAGIGRSNSTAQCSDWLYVWGQLANANSNRTSLRTISVLACNETIEAVDTDVFFSNSDLLIDPEDPPVPSNNTARDTTVAMSDLDYSLLSNSSSRGLLDPFFDLLSRTDSRATTNMLGNSTTEAVEGIVAAIKHQHGVIRAQSINFKSRRHLTTSGTFPLTDQGIIIRSGVDARASPSVAVPSFTGTAADDVARLHQNLIATRILEALLGAALLFHMLSWILTPRTRLPKPPTTIASVAALLVDGNILDYLPPGAEWHPLHELQQLFVDDGTTLVFKLRWKNIIQQQDRKSEGRRPRERLAYGIRVRKVPTQEDHIEMDTFRRDGMGHKEYA